jgi:alpha-methylacyl-CoA racemase
MGPLSGCRVVELSGIGPGPFAGMILADLGAEVVRVDRPAAGPARAEKFDILGRGKKSVVLDLKQPEAVAAVLDLVAGADALIEGYRPGVAERLGLGPADCLARNPSLVYGRMTGWGQEGPLAQSAGHDIAYIALTGALHAIGEAGGPPQIPLNLLGDFGGGGAYLVIGVLAALLAVRGGAPGQVVDAAIVDGTASLLSMAHSMLGSGAWADQRGANLLDGGAPFYSVYETADGRHMAVGALEPQFYAEFVTRLGLDEDLSAQHDRSGWGGLRGRIAAAFASRTQDEWTKVFEGTDACVAPVLGLREAAGHPQLAARGTIVTRDGVLQPAPAPRFSATPSGGPAAPPARGAHDAAAIAAGWRTRPDAPRNGGDPRDHGEGSRQASAKLADVTQENLPAVPETPAQQARYDRVIAAATEILSGGGQEAVQMKDLAQRAGVSLATLYRYFPSKDYVLLAVTLSRYQRAAVRTADRPPQGGTVVERAAAHLRREFRAEQRDQRLTAALVSALTGSGRSYSAILEAAEHAHLQVVRQAAAGCGRLSEQQERLLTIVVDVFAAATRRWLAGTYSVADVEAQIEIGCRLLALPDEVIDAERVRVAPDVVPRSPASPEVSLTQAS